MAVSPPALIEHARVKVHIKRAKDSSGDPPLCQTRCRIRQKRKVGETAGQTSESATNERAVEIIGDVSVHAVPVEAFLGFLGRI